MWWLKIKISIDYPRRFIACFETPNKKVITQADLLHASRRPTRRWLPKEVHGMGWDTRQEGHLTREKCIAGMPEGAATLVKTWESSCAQFGEISRYEQCKANSEQNATCQVFDRANSKHTFTQSHEHKLVLETNCQTAIWYVSFRQFYHVISYFALTTIEI